jgi:hypothetical protein
LEVTDTSFEETFYDAEVGNAYYRKKNNRIGWSKYDNKSRPIYLRIQDTIYQCSYDLNDRVSNFMIIDSVKNDSTKYEYGYDNNGDLNSVTKNGVIYTLKGNINSDKIEINREGANLIVYLENKEMVGLQNRYWSKQTIDSNYLNREANKKIDLEAKQAAAEAINAKAVTRKESPKQSAERIKEEIKARRKIESEQKTVTDAKKILLNIYEGEFKDLMVPKLIPHEWIWEKL